MLEKYNNEAAGYIKKHHDKLLTSISEQELGNFAKLKSDEERFSFVYKLALAHELDIQLSETTKNTNVASKVKDQGNKAFQSGDYHSALQLYSKSILKTPWEKDSSREVAVTLANRSAATYHLQQYLPCLQDIELVLKLDYPKELRYKVLDRKARCLLALKQLKAALETFRSTLTALDSSTLSFERRQKWQTDVQIMISMLSRNDKMQEGGLLNEPLPATDISLPQLTGGRNPAYPASSARVAIAESPEMGRYAEANQDVKVGETLVVEKPHVSVLLQEHCNTHCYQCFKILLVPVPCNYCCAVAFCTDNCKSVAMSTHHGVECKLLTAIWSYGASITCHLSLRIITQRNVKYFLDKRQQLEQSKETDIKKYTSSDYLSVYHLVRHENTRTREDYLQRADMAVFLFRCLKLGGFFTDDTSNSGSTELTDKERFIGGLLLRHLQSVHFNAHEISELQFNKDGKLETATSVFLGGGLYPTLALFNHSCDPSVTRYFCGTSVIVRAVNNIGRGEMIAENYGPIFTQCPMDERRVKLKSLYWFDCTCTACTEDWPLLRDMDPAILRFRCDANGASRCNSVLLVPANTDEFMMACKTCNEHTNILKGLKALQDTDALFKLATRHLQNNELSQALAKFIEILTLLSETLAPPFRDYHLCQQGIRRCMLALGNRMIRQ